MWEYKLVPANVPDPVLEQTINALGQLGWELITFLPSHNKLIFKRPFTAPPETVKEA